MNEPCWLAKDFILAAHDKLVAVYGGLPGTREDSLLESALARPQQLFIYDSPTLFQTAATYAHGIMRNHPFLDGNKRTGLMAAYLFLRANNFRLNSPEEVAISQTLALASSEIGAEEYAQWLETSSVSEG